MEERRDFKIDLKRRTGVQENGDLTVCGVATSGSLGYCLRKGSLYVSDCHFYLNFTSFSKTKHYTGAISVKNLFFFLSHLCDCRHKLSASRISNRNSLIASSRNIVFWLPFTKMTFCHSVSYRSSRIRWPAIFELAKVNFREQIATQKC